MDIKKPQLVKVGAFAYFFEGVLQHPRYADLYYVHTLYMKNLQNLKDIHWLEYEIRIFQFSLPNKYSTHIVLSWATPQGIT